MARVVVRPSDLNSFVYCPRRSYIDYYLGMHRTLIQRFKMLLGKFIHILYRLFRSGFIREELFKVDVYGLDVILVGRPDAYKIHDGYMVLEELKTGRSPKRYLHGVRVWLSDLIQVLAYAYMLSRMYNPGKIIVRVVYRDHNDTFQYNIAYENLLFCYLERYKRLVNGWVPPPLNHPGKCSKCRYKEICKDFSNLNVSEG